MPENKRILITGGNGFLGTHLALALTHNNRVVSYGLDDRNALPFTELPHHPHFSCIHGDVRDRSHLETVIEELQPQLVIHCAARAGVSTYFEDPIETMEVNLLGTYTLVSALKHHSPERFVYLSTSEVYGPNIFDAQEGGLTVQGDPKVPRWSYAVSKLAGEHLCFAHMHGNSLPVTCVRPFNVYGPLQLGEGAMAIFIRQALANETIRITGHGHQIRAWCYVEDFVAGLLGVLDTNETIGEVINLGNPKGTLTIRSLVETIIRLTNSRSEIALMPHPGGRRGEIQVRVPSVEKAAELIAFAPQVDLEEGILRTARWFHDLDKHEVRGRA